MARIRKAKLKGVKKKMDYNPELNLGEGECWLLRLYVAGKTPKSLEAFANLKKIAETHLKGQYRIEIIDLMENPELAKGDEILAIPTLIRRLPLPIRKVIGTLADEEKVLIGLEIIPA